MARDNATVGPTPTTSARVAPRDPFRLGFPQPTFEPDAGTELRQNTQKVGSSPIPHIPTFTGLPDWRRARRQADKLTVAQRRRPSELGVSWGVIR